MHIFKLYYLKVPKLLLRYVRQSLFLNHVISIKKKRNEYGRKAGNLSFSMKIDTYNVSKNSLQGDRMLYHSAERTFSAGWGGGVVRTPPEPPQPTGLQC